MGPWQGINWIDRAGKAIARVRQDVWLAFPSFPGALPSRPVNGVTPMPRHKVRRPWLDYLVYLAVRLVVAFAQVLTIEQSYALARLLAWVMYQVDRRHRIVGVENLTAAFGDHYDEEERDRIVRGVYLHFCTMIMEILHIPRKIHLTNWRNYVRLVGHEPVLDRLLTGGPIIFLTGHYGNWEMAGYLFGLFGFPTYSVARTLDNPYLDRFLRTFRESTGQKLIPKSGGYDQILEVLQSGRALRCWPTRTQASAGSSSTSSAGRPRPTRPSRSWPSSTGLRWPSASPAASARASVTRSAAPMSSSPRSSTAPPTTPGSSPSGTLQPWKT